MLKRIRRVLELFAMTLFPGVYGHWQKYLLDRRKVCMNCDVHCCDVTNTNVIVKNNYCGELVGGEFVTTTVKFLQDCLFVYRGRANSGKIALLWKRKVPESTCTTRGRTVVMCCLATPAQLVVWSLYIFVLTTSND